ncbi:hypothetical protein GCM10010492_13650 [Saccharothrix mutabilis subsp. mutabilis]|uniref:Uncharacterized protein n=1 Tax=Saccharothrix mutabilis subsp. mutabilis TaxID=66855 RepID=A0ABN0TAW4_9PSEU
MLRNLVTTTAKSMPILVTTYGQPHTHTNAAPPLPDHYFRRRLPQVPAAAARRGPPPLAAAERGAVVRRFRRSGQGQGAGAGGQGQGGW